MGRQAQVDAEVRGQRMRGLRYGMAVETAGRADRRHPHVRADAHRDHGALRLLAETQEPLDFCGQHGIVSDVEVIALATPKP